jgi:hypothetical protein
MMKKMDGPLVAGNIYNGHHIPMTEKKVNNIRRRILLKHSYSKIQHAFQRIYVSSSAIQVKSDHGYKKTLQSVQRTVCMTNEKQGYSEMVHQ